MSSDGSDEEGFDYDETIFGAKSTERLDDTTILFIGKTGSGKSTLQNMCANAAQRKNYEDDRVVIINQKTAIFDEKSNQTEIIEMRCNVPQFKSKQSDSGEPLSESQTTKVSRYDFQLRNFKLTQIDTPGLGDSRGIKQNLENIAQIVKAFKRTGGFKAIAFVHQAGDSKIDPMLVYLVGCLRSILTKDCINNMVVCYTFVEDKTRVPAKETLKTLGVLLPETKEYYFNNACVTPFSERKKYYSKKQVKKLTSCEPDDWEENVLQAQKLVRDASRMRTVEGNEIAEQYVSKNIAHNLVKNKLQSVALVKNLQDSCKIQKRRIEAAQAKMEDNKDFTSMIKVTKKVLREEECEKDGRVDISPNKSTTCILKECLQTCHHHCSIPMQSVIGDQAFLGCNAFNGKPTCEHCGHDIKHHYHSTWEVVKAKTKQMVENFEQTMVPYTDELKKKTHEENKKIKDELSENLEKNEAELKKLEDLKQDSYRVVAYLKKRVESTAADNSVSYAIRYYEDMKAMNETQYQNGVVTKEEYEARVKDHDEEIAIFKELEKEPASDVNPKIAQEAEAMIKKEMEELIQGEDLYMQAT